MQVQQAGPLQPPPEAPLRFAGLDMVKLTWAVAVLWVLYGFAALALQASPRRLPPPTNLPIERLSVQAESSKEPVDCPREAGSGRFRCHKDVWHFVGPYAGRANGAPIRCLWVHPPKAGHALTLRFDDVPLPGPVSATLALMPGSNGGARVTAAVQINGRSVGAASTEHEREVGRLQAARPADARGEVQVRIQAKNNRWRLACLQLRAGESSSPVDNAAERDRER